jgi:hypothetical protein
MACVPMGIPYNGQVTAGDEDHLHPLNPPWRLPDRRPLEGGRPRLGRHAAAVGDRGPGNLHLRLRLPGRTMSLLDVQALPDTRGVDLGRRDQLRWQKGSTWVLDGDPRSPHTARYLPPPA